jgi:hypothetical protein
VQLELKFRTHGGARRGAGRPRTSNRVPHTARPKLASRYPVHITLDIVDGLPGLRSKRCRGVLCLALADSARRAEFRIVHYSIQERHLHLIVEALNARWLSRGIQGLKIRIARRLNKKLGRSGPLFADRYHMRILRTPREVWFALRYVLCNAHKHGARDGWGELGGLYDPLSSAVWFDGWERGLSLRSLRARGTGPPPVAPARTWLMKEGWSRHGRMELDWAPASRRSMR